MTQSALKMEAVGSFETSVTVYKVYDDVTLKNTIFREDGNIRFLHNAGNHLENSLYHYIRQKIMTFHEEGGSSYLRNAGKNLENSLYGVLTENHDL
jgi:hypothetical protein